MPVNVNRIPKYNPLFLQYKTFTHGGIYWSDNYQLEHWAESRQPVVYRDQVYNGYPLIRRLGCWSWMTRCPKTHAFSTIKFLSRPKNNEVDISLYIRDHARSPFLCKIQDHFTIPHHLSHMEEYKDIDFDVIVYPLLGSDVARVLIGDEVYEGDPTIRDEDDRKERIARQVVRAVADLHRIRVVHADIHAGNVGLPPPSDEFLTEFLAKPPLEDNVIRKDGKSTPPNLPNRVTEPEYIRYGDEDSCKLFDFGYSFRPTPGRLYDNSVFPRGTSLPPEILRDGDKTAHPFKVDSWQLGIFMYYILTGRARPFDRGLDEDESREHYRKITKRVRDGKDEFMLDVPKSIRSKYSSAITALWEENPAKRLSVTELSQDKEFMQDI